MLSDECLQPTENGFELYVFLTRRDNGLYAYKPPSINLLRRLTAHWLMWMDFGQAPEIQTMYSVPFPVSTIRTRMRQEFERHRYVNKLPVVDVLIMQNNAEYQVRSAFCCSYKQLSIIDSNKEI
jgi:hypothetical protein